MVPINWGLMKYPLSICLFIHLSWITCKNIWAKRDPKCLEILNFTANQYCGLLWFFALTYNSIKAENWVKLFWQISYFDVFKWKRLQNEPKWSFFKFYSRLKHYMFLFFAWGYNSLKVWYCILHGTIVFVFSGKNIVLGFLG